MGLHILFSSSDICGEIRSRKELVREKRNGYNTST
jgi:hypothetical protein